jgi:peptidyl-dipeptidase Dcp
MSANPFFEKNWNTAFELPRFGDIRTEHYGPAFDKGLAEHAAEIQAIAENPEPPTFENTIAAFEKSGELLSRVGRVFWNLAGSNSNEEIQKIERDISPRLSVHYSAVYMNGALFARIDKLFNERAKLGLNPEQLRVLELIHKDFVRSGAKLGEESRKRVADISSRLATLTTSFGQNILKDEADYTLVLEAPGDLAGLPESLVASAAATAKTRGIDGKHVITLSRSHVEPFLQFSTRRDLREILFDAWTKRGEREGATNNMGLISEIVQLRAERAKLLGYETFADYKLDNTMAKTAGAVRDLLDRVWAGGLSRAEADRAELQKIADSEGANFSIAAHDWRHYVEKLRRQKFDLDEGELKSYFQLDNIRAAAFDVANKLFGLSFEEVRGLDVYHPDVRTFEVKDKSGKHVALFVADDFARPSKRSGAWMSNFRTQEKLRGDRRPIVVNVLNIAKPGEGQPVLLSLDEARTLFHEFGHALHGMLSDVTHPRISGTSVPTDFVELPSQLYEHWVLQPQVLEKFARHYMSGAPMPTALREKVLAMRTFNQGFATVEYCSSAYIDMDLHELAPPATVDPAKFERERLAAINMPKEIVMRHRTPHFAHVFSGDHYAAGYYSYLWSEVLDADAFNAFEEAGDIFDPGVAKRLKDYIYSAGGAREPGEAYIAFRGRLPTPDALMEKRGLA